MGVKGNRLLIFVATLQMLLWLFDFFPLKKKNTAALLSAWTPWSLGCVCLKRQQKESVREMITYILSRVDSCEMSFHNTNLDLHQQEVVVTVINGIAWVEINGNAALR